MQRNLNKIRDMGLLKQVCVLVLFFPKKKLQAFLICMCVCGW